MYICIAHAYPQELLYMHMYINYIYIYSEYNNIN